MRKLIRDHIEPYEDNFVFYKKKGIRHFYEYSKSAHEGTNTGLKHCCGGVKPSHLIEDSSERFSFQGIRFYKTFVAEVQKQMNESQPWSGLECTKCIVNFAAQLVLQEYEMYDKYESIRVSDSKVLVRIEESERKSPVKMSPISAYKRTREVTLHDNFLKCVRLDTYVGKIV